MVLTILHILTLQTNKSVHFRTTTGMTWLSKEQIENMLVEKLSDIQVWTVIRWGIHSLNCLNFTNLKS